MSSCVVCNCSLQCVYVVVCCISSFPVFCCCLLCFFFRRLSWYMEGIVIVHM